MDANVSEGHGGACVAIPTLRPRRHRHAAALCQACSAVAEFMATMCDALALLAGHPRGLLAGAVAEGLWPGGSRSNRRTRAWNRPDHGGPTGGERAAAGLLGRMSRKGWVLAGSQVGGTRADRRTYWRLTDRGRAALGDCNLGEGRACN
jgi:hypothetical protein